MYHTAGSHKETGQQKKVTLAAYRSVGWWVACVCATRRRKEWSAVVSVGCRWCVTTAACGKQQLVALTITHLFSTTAEFRIRERMPVRFTRMNGDVMDRDLELRGSHMESTWTFVHRE